MQSLSLWKPLAVAVLLLSGCGCGGSDGPFGVSGTVLFKGEPLDQGRIDFIPPGNTGSQSGATIENGTFTIPRDKGLLPGTYEVRIWSYDKTGAKVPEPIPGDPGARQFKERIAKRFNVDTTLRAEVKPGNTTFEFKVE